MKKLLITIAAIGSQLCCFAQKSDTITITGQKGFLFLTNYNYQYDYHGGEIRPVGFHDFFFPGECLDSFFVLDSNRAVSFKRGLRVDYIENRLSLKQKAMLVKGADTSDCYSEPQFYILPVIISYQQCEDYWPFICRRNYFDIQVENGAALHFEYQHQMIKPTSIMPIGKSVPIKINEKKAKGNKPKPHEAIHMNEQ